jgi:hypothetical protein
MVFHGWRTTFPDATVREEPLPAGHCGYQAPLTYEETTTANTAQTA